MAADSLPTDEDDGFHTIASMKLAAGQSAGMSFAVPKELEGHAASNQYVKHAFEYYLLARYSFFHRMNYAFTINSFWAAEYLCLSILVTRYTQDELKPPHDLPRYWRLAKGLLPPPVNDCMNRFDNFLAVVQGYFDERYVKPVSARGRLIHTDKKPRVGVGDENRNYPNFGKVVPLNLSELDHFVNFILHDIAGLNEVSHNIGVRLDWTDNGELYMRENEFSVVYPNKKYHGELK